MRTAGGSFTVSLVPKTTNKCREKPIKVKEKRDFKFWNLKLQTLTK
jgi:hypothetical protein